MFAGLTKRIKNWWYGESDMKRQLGFSENTETGIKNSRGKQARWKRFEIADHLATLEDEGFAVNKGQAYYDISKTLADLYAMTWRTPTLQLSRMFETTEYFNVIYLLWDMYSSNNLKNDDKLDELVSACEAYDRYTHDHPESRSGQKGHDRRWFVKAVRSAALKEISLPKKEN